MLVHQAIMKPLVKGDVGIEIEVESLDLLPAVNNHAFTSKPDGSLRHCGNEYVTNGVATLDKDFKQNLTKLCKDIETSGRVIKDSPRTSVHVHVNISNLTLSQAWTGILSAWLMETVFVEGCGPERVGNLFCLRLKDAEYLIPTAQKDLRSPTPFTQHLMSDHIKYSGTNLNAIARFGSVETRYKGGSIDPDDIYSWSSLHHAVIHNAANEYKTPSKFIDTFCTMAKRDFVESIIGKDRFKQYVEPIQGWEDMVEEQLGIIAPVAYTHTWDKWEDKVQKYYEKNKLLQTPINPPALGQINDPAVRDMIQRHLLADVAPVRRRRVHLDLPVARQDDAVFVAEEPRADIIIEDDIEF